MNAIASLEAPPTATLSLSSDLMPDLGRWLEVAGIGRGGALLVRPDQHVAWRSAEVLPAAAAALAGAFEALLGPRPGV